MTFGTVYTGLGGFDLGLASAGWACRFQAESDASLRALLSRHWPAARQHADAAAAVAHERETVDLLYAELPGGPCGWADAAGAPVMLALERAQWLLLEGSPAPWSEVRPTHEPLIACGWRVAYRLVVYATYGDDGGRSLVRKRLWMLASRVGNPSAACDALGLSPDVPEGKPPAAPGPVAEAPDAPVADLEGIRLLPDGWTAGLDEAAARAALAGAASPFLGYAVASVLAQA